MTVPYVTPPTAVAGYGLPAADWNSKVRDSLESSAKPPRVAVARSTDLAINHNVVSPVDWTTEVYDTDNFWVIGTPDRFTVPANLGGVYLVTFNPIFALNATGGRYAAIYKNGGVYAGAAPVNVPPNATWYTEPCLTAIVPLAPGDTIQGVAYQASGGVMNLPASVYPMGMSMCRIGVA